MDLTNYCWLGLKHFFQSQWQFILYTVNWTVNFNSCSKRLCEGIWSKSKKRQQLWHYFGHLTEFFFICAQAVVATAGGRASISPGPLFREDNRSMPVYLYLLVYAVQPPVYITWPWAVHSRGFFLSQIWGIRQVRNIKKTTGGYLSF